jgi:hypothetical protein
MSQIDPIKALPTGNSKVACRQPNGSHDGSPMQPTIIFSPISDMPIIF